MARGILLACLVFASAACAAAAQSPGPSDAAKAMAGTWEFANADRDKICSIVFRTDTGPGGMKLEFDRGCIGRFPFIREIAAWTIADNDFLRFVDTRGRPVLEFSEVESGVYEAPRPGEGILFVQKPMAAPAAARTAGDVAGEWNVMRGGKPLCALTLSNTASGEDFAIRVNPPCDALVTRFGPATWQMDRGELLLKSARGQTWRFEEGEESSWRRVPDTANPVLLVRK
jgi:hypothetical protein